MRIATLMGVFLVVGCGGSSAAEEPPPTTTTAGFEEPSGGQGLAFGEVAIVFEGELPFQLRADGTIELNGEPVARLGADGSVSAVDGGRFAQLEDSGTLVDLETGGPLVPGTISESAYVAENGNSISISDAGELTAVDASGQAVPVESLGLQITGASGETRRSALLAMAVSMWLLREIADREAEEAPPVEE